MRFSNGSSLDKSGEWRHSLALYDQLREDMAEDALSDAADGPNSRWGQDTELPSPRVTVAALTACARWGFGEGYRCFGRFFMLPQNPIHSLDNSKMGPAPSINQSDFRWNPRPSLRGDQKDTKAQSDVSPFYVFGTLLRAADFNKAWL